MRIAVYEDRGVGGLAPLAAARPAFELVCGAGQVLHRLRRHFEPHDVGALVRKGVADVTRHRHGLPVNDPTWLRREPTVLVNARWLPAVASPPSDTELLADSPFLALCDGTVAFAVLPPELLSAVQPNTLDDCLDDWAGSLPTFDVSGTVLRTPADLVRANDRQIERDFQAIADHDGQGRVPANVFVIGPTDRLDLDPTARLDPLVVIDTTHGPVWVQAAAHVTAFTRLEGPCVIGTGSVVLRGDIRGGTTIGPRCRVGGAVESSIFHGFVHKPDDGCVRSSYIGEGVDFAGESGVHVGGGVCVVADHAWIGSGVWLDAGTRIGPFADVRGVAPADVPAFAAVGGVERPDAERFRFAAERLGVAFGEWDVAAYRALEAKSAGRRAWMIESEQPRLRRAG